jgi:pseudouridine-5'-monophosphatase
MLKISKIMKLDKNSTLPVTHVIFDLDGTILDTESVYRKAYRKVCKKYGKSEKLTKKVENKVMGIPAMQVANVLKKECDFSLSAKELRSELDKNVQPMFESVRLKPGAEKLITHLLRSGVPVALATSSRKKNAKLKMAGYRYLFEGFSHMVFRDDEGISEGKPSPDVFLKAMELFPDECSTDNCLVFEDSENGVKAALSAGLQVVLIPDSNPLSFDDVPTYKSLDDFRPEDYGLPPYEDYDENSNGSEE